MKLSRWLSPNRVVKYLGDTLLITGAYYLAFFLRFDGYILPQFWTIFVNSLPLVLLVKVALLHYFQLYDSFWRYTGLSELQVLLKALSLASIYIAVSYAIAAGLTGFPRSVFFLDWFISLIALGSFRLLPRLLREGSFPILSSLKPGSQKIKQPRPENVVLFGAGDLGASLARQIEQSYAGRKKLLGFIDDNPSFRNMRIHGVEVLGDRHILGDLARKKRIDEIIVTISAISGKKLSEIVEHCRQFCPNVQVAPSLEELFKGNVKISDIREVQIEDLLGRERVSLDERKLESFLTDKRILVTGAGGSIGSELCFQILKFQPRTLILFGRGENSIYATRNRLDPHANGTQLEEIIGDIINYAKLDKVFAGHHPEIVFHAAADKHVPLMETNPDEAVLNNIVGTQNVLEVAQHYGAEKVVCISSDKAVNPTSVMGCCKRVSELLVYEQSYKKTTSCAVRFGNVLGSRGSVIPLFKQQIAMGGPVTITHPEIKRYFMTIPEAVLLVVQAGAICSGGEIFLLEMGQSIRILDLARQMIRLSGFSEDKIPIEFVGLRPGEKLEEELAFSYETVTKTSIPKLYRLEGRPPGRIDLHAQVTRLKSLGIAMDFEGIQRTLQSLVPEYRPHSRQRVDVAVAGGSP